MFSVLGPLIFLSPHEAPKGLSRQATEAHDHPALRSRLPGAFRHARAGGGLSLLEVLCQHLHVLNFGGALQGHHPSKCIVHEFHYMSHGPCRTPWHTEGPLVRGGWG